MGKFRAYIPRIKDRCITIRSHDNPEHTLFRDEVFVLNASKTNPNHINFPDDIAQPYAIDWFEPFSSSR
jgi:hypothetical protein